MITRYSFLPYRLREWLFCKVYTYFPNIKDKDVSLAVNPNVRLDLQKTDFGHKSIIFTGFYEIELTRHISSLAKKGGLMVDVGANYGYYSCIWAGARPDNKAYSFEASPFNKAPLENNVQKNGFSNQVKVLPFALGKEKDKLQFTTGGNADQTSWGGLTTAGGDATIEVDVETLDNFAAANNITQIDVLKIDTEGADTWVLYGAERLLKEKKICNLFFEHNLERMGYLGIKPEEAITFLTSLGYEIKRYSPLEFYAYPKA